MDGVEGLSESAFPSAPTFCASFVILLFIVCCSESFCSSFFHGFVLNRVFSMTILRSFNK